MALFYLGDYSHFSYLKLGAKNIQVMSEFCLSVPAIYERIPFIEYFFKLGKDSSKQGYNLNRLVSMGGNYIFSECMPRPQHKDSESCFNYMLVETYTLKRGNDMLRWSFDPVLYEQTLNENPKLRFTLEIYGIAANSDRSVLTNKLQPFLVSRDIKLLEHYNSKEDKI